VNVIFIGFPPAIPRAYSASLFREHDRKGHATADKPRTDIGDVTAAEAGVTSFGDQR